MVNTFKQYFKKKGATRSFKLKWFFMALFIWTLLDLFVYNRWQVYSTYITDNLLEAPRYIIKITWVVLSLGYNVLLGWLMFYVVPGIKERKHPIAKRLVKFGLMFSAIFAVSIIAYLSLILFSKNIDIRDIFHRGGALIYQSNYLVDGVFIKCLIVLLTQLFYQLGQKYTPGFFIHMLLGRYSAPRTEDRIIMFIDLKDSTPISEQLGHKKYFLFIKEFIYEVSNAALQCNGDIYQYVGDEVIITWAKEPDNNMKCIQVLISVRKALQSKAQYFKQEYGFVPEFRAGIHVGEVTVGEIGVVKKDLAMSGEAMNTTARIRSACSELNYKHIVSEKYFDYTNLKDWQGESLGEIQLKGLEKKNLTLYALKI